MNPDSITLLTTLGLRLPKKNRKKQKKNNVFSVVSANLVGIHFCYLSNDVFYLFPESCCSYNFNRSLLVIKKKGCLIRTMVMTSSML